MEHGRIQGAPARRKLAFFPFQPKIIPFWHEGGLQVRLPAPAFSIHLLRRLPLLFLPLCLVLLSAQAARALPEKNASCGVVCSEARKLLRESENNRERALKAAVLLEEHAPPTFRTAGYPLLLAEAWYRSADSDANIKQTWPIYKKVRAYAEKALAIDPGRTEALYWLGLAKLRKAQKVRGIRAFFLVWSAIDDLEKVRAERPRYDQGGAARVLSLLYRVAPQWTPFGNMKKAVRYARDAVRVSGNYPLNRLYLARAYLGVEKVAAAAEQLRKVIALSPNPFTAEARRELADMGQPVL